MNYFYIVFIMHLVCLLGMCVVCVVNVHGGNRMSLVNKLQNHLFEDHNKAVLPRHNTRDPVIVSIESSLDDLSCLHEADNILEANMYFHLEWTDEFLTWNLSEFNITELSIEKDKIWLPDVFMTNGLGDSRYLPVQDQMIYITHSGHVSWWPGGNIKTKCKLDVSKYPFDSQLCKIMLDPWSSTTSEQIFQILHSKEVELLKKFDDNAEWEVTNLSEIVYVNEFYGQYRMAHYEFCINLKRRSLYHIVNIVLPVILLSLISNCSYLIPPSSGEKMSLSVSIFLSFAVYVTVINNELPKTANGICYFGMYLCTQLVISGLTIILSALVLHVYHDQRKIGMFHLCKKKMYTSDKITEVNEQGHDIEITKNKTFAVQMDRILFRAVLIFNLISFLVFIIVSKV